MKKTIIKFLLKATIIVALVFNYSAIYSQSGWKWSSALNAASPADALGTSNNQALLIMVNNTLALQIKPGGSVLINSFANAGNGLVGFDNSGKLVQNVFPNDATKVLLGNGTWGYNGWKISGNDLFQTTTGNVFIGGSLNAGQFTLSGNNIISLSGNIDFVNNNLTTTGNITAGTISSNNISALNSDVDSLQSAVGGQQVEIDTLQSVVGNIQTSQWQSNDTNIFFNTGNVGLGISEPLVKFDVVGDVRISQNLYVGGGIIISEKVNATRELKSAALRADSIIMDSTKAVYGDVILKNKLKVNGDVQVNGNFNTGGNITSTGNVFSNAIISNSIQTSQLTITDGTFTTDTLHALKQLTINNSLKIAKEDINSYAEVSTKDTAITLVLQKDTAGQVVIGPADSVFIPLPGQAKDKLTVIGNTLLQGDVSVKGNFKTTGSLTFAGNKTIGYLPASGGNPDAVCFAVTPPPPMLNICFNPAVSLNQFSGLIQSIGYNNSNPNIMTMGFNGTNGIIDMAGSSIEPFDAKGLLINYYCGKDVSVCTGTHGGNVYLTSSGSVGVGTLTPNAKLNIKSDSTLTGLLVETSFDSTTHGYGIVSNVGVNGDNTIAFAVKKDTTNNFIVYGNGHVYARDVIVKLGYLGDFVFNDDYKLMTIYELENYIKQNHHLPKIPSAKEVNESGLNVGEFQNLLLQKTEEQALYIINMQKQIDYLKKEIEELKKKN